MLIDNTTTLVLIFIVAFILGVLVSGGLFRRQLTKMNAKAQVVQQLRNHINARIRIGDNLEGKIIESSEGIINIVWKPDESVELNNRSYSPEDYTIFNDAKNSLLSYYSGGQTSLGALLIGYAVGLFTLLEAVRNVRDTSLSKVFAIPIPNWMNLEWIPFLKLLAFSIIIFALTTLIVRTVFRYSAFAGICNSIVGKPLPNGLTPETVHVKINEAAINNCQNERLFWTDKIKVKYFVSGILREKDPNDLKVTQSANTKTNEYNNRLGWMISMSFALFLTILLVWLLF